MQMCMTRMRAADYTFVISWLSKLVEWMPTMLVDNPWKRADILAMLAESELAVNRVDECLRLVNEALPICYSVALIMIKLKAMLVHSVDDTEIVDLFNSFKLTSEKVSDV